MDNNNAVNEKIFNGEFYFNIFLHIFILFTILHFFYKYYIFNITTDVINNEFKHVIDNIFENIDSSKIINDENLFKNLKEIINDENISKNLKEIINENLLKKLKEIINNENNNNNSTKIINNNSTKINNNSTNNQYAKLINFEYYLNIYSEENVNRKKINDLLFNNLNFFNIFLFFLLILITFILLKTESINLTEIYFVIIENIIAFFFVGIIEFLFFLYIASKYIPTKPSLIYDLLLTNFKNYLQ